MQQHALRRDLDVRSGDVTLAGSLWMPVGRPAATVLMHPGSGPSDRDNDVYFPPIRAHLLEAGIAVASFDKRGVGESTGRWEEAGIVEQADDAIVCLGALLSDLAPDSPVGLFGHSQGGWVVVEAASRGGDVAFVITNAGPGVTPAEQERWATRAYMRRAAIPESEIEEVDRYFDHLLSLMRAGVPFEQVQARVDAEGFPPAFETLGLPFLPESADQWSLMAAMVDYDPRPALERIEVPLLALFGAEDPITPVADSVSVYREAVRPDVLRVEVFPGADHRLQVGDPPELVDGYRETLASFILGAVACCRRPPGCVGFV
jgi:pimeloyl-ACP methyl ester carboxylesterase